MIEDLPGRSTETRYARVPLWLFEKGLSLQAIAVYAWLHGRYGHYEKTMPGYKTLAKELDIGKTSVIDRVTELKKAGALRVEARYDGGRRTTNEYVIAFNEPFPVEENGEGGRYSDPGGRQGDPHGRYGDPRGSVERSAEVDQEEEDGDTKTSSSSEPSAPTQEGDEGKPEKPPREDVMRLCEHLADRIEGNGAKRPTIGKRWMDAARLMLDRDGRSEDQVHTAIDWCQDNEFWRSNILSMPKLREQYDQLRLKAIAERKALRRSSPSNVDVWDAYARQQEGVV